MIGAWRFACSVCERPIERVPTVPPMMYLNRTEPLIWESRPDGLRAPAIICASAAGTMRVTRHQRRRRPSGSRSGRALRWDRPEDSYDFELMWPEIGFTEDGKRETTVARRRDLRCARPARPPRPHPRPTAACTSDLQRCGRRLQLRLSLSRPYACRLERPPWLQPRRREPGSWRQPPALSPRCAADGPHAWHRCGPAWPVSRELGIDAGLA